MNESPVGELVEGAYAELRRLAEKYLGAPGQTLQPTAVVHEAYLKLAQSHPDAWESREHFLAVAARAMRQILVDAARRRLTAKRGGDRARVTLTGLAEGSESGLDALVLDDALSRLALVDERLSRVVELRFFGGLSVPEVAQVLGQSSATVERDWRKARAWLRVQLG